MNSKGITQLKDSIYIQPADTLLTDTPQKIPINLLKSTFTNAF